MSHKPIGYLTKLAFVLGVAISQLAAADEPKTASESGQLRVGTFAMDVTPTQYPVIVNGMFEERMADRDVDPLFARAFVFDDGSTRIAIAVVDSCMLPRELLDAAKTEASKRTGIAVDHMLVSATHTHSAPSSMGCLGSRSDANYPAFLIPRIARAIASAAEQLQPAQIGFAKLHAPNHTYCRSYIRWPDRVMKDPFGEATVRANMHPGYLSPDAIGPSGPVDDELSLLAMQTADGKPLGVLANFSMHYVSSPMVSSDYFGRFAEHLAERIDGSTGSTSCVVSMSQGTSGDLASMNYDGVAAPKRDYDEYAKELAAMAYEAYRGVKYESHATLAMREAKLTLGRRVPSAERLAWAKTIAAKVGDRRPKGWPEVYALEQIELAAEPQRELKLQAVRIGDIAIAAIPNEVYAISGLKLKLQSPLPHTFNIELANGAEGYIPPPEQHKLGGYTTWAARTAGLEVEAEPKIVATLLALLEKTTGKPRRPLPTGGAYAAAVLKSKPRAYWRLADIDGNTAVDISGNHLDARYEDGIAHYLPGPTGKGMSAGGQASRSAHLAGGRVVSHVPDIGDSYSVEFWFWNGMPNDARDVTGYLFSRSSNSNDTASSDHVGIDGGTTGAGKLYFSSGSMRSEALKGQTTIEPKSWCHVVIVRDGGIVRTYLNGQLEPGMTGDSPADSPTASSKWFFGGRSDGSSGLEGKLSDAAIYGRALMAEEVAKHYKAADVPAGN